MQNHLPRFLGKDAPMIIKSPNDISDDQPVLITWP